MMHAALAALTEPLPMLALWHLHLMEHVQTWMRDAGCPVLFGLLFSCGVGLPLPEDVPLLFAGYFVATGEMHLLPAAVCAWCGIIGGDCVLYGIGRRYGMGIKSVPIIGRHIDAGKIDKLHDQFEKYGVWVVAVGRLFAGVRGAMVLVAGTIRFTFVHFIIADGLAAIFSGGLFMGLGYFAGKKFGDLKQVHHEIERYSMWLLLGVVATALVVLAAVWWRKRGQARRNRPDVAPTPATVDAPQPPAA